MRALLIALVLTGCGGSGASATPITHLIQGTVSLNDSEGFTVGPGTCVGDGGFSDLRAGSAVTVKDQAGTIIATSSLNEGSPNVRACSFKFTLLSVPDADFYSIEVSHRGALSYSRSDLEAAGWTVALSIGD